MLVVSECSTWYCAKWQLNPLIESVVHFRVLKSNTWKYRKMLIMEIFHKFNILEQDLSIQFGEQKISLLSHRRYSVVSDNTAFHHYFITFSPCIVRRYLSGNKIS